MSSKKKQWGIKPRSFEDGSYEFDSVKRKREMKRRQYEDSESHFKRNLNHLDAWFDEDEWEDIS